ncbi:MAG TPA: multicopper oxidase domain-containing protein, partial [bacterium]|nr:multicopper oxidase domain-containing protein [bacterium]
VVSYVAYNDKFEEAPKGAELPPVKVPAPTIRVKVGDEVHVFFHNTGHKHTGPNSQFKDVTHTIHFHGLDLVQAYDGVPGVPAKMLPERVLGGVPVGDVYEYKFVATDEGTYSYHCHVDSSTHILLGMYGPFIVEAKEPNTIYGYKYDREYTLMLSEMDTTHNDAIADQGTYDMLKWKSNVFLINGRMFSADLKNPLSTIADPASVIKAKEGETVLIRFMAMTFNHTFVMHPHAYHMMVVGTDGRKLPAPYWKDTLPISSGERYDVLVPIMGKKDKICLSCGLGPGISVMHDHNLMGEASNGKYPKGALTIFVVE